MNDQLKHQIETYLADAMSAEELTAFEVQMKNDAELRAEVDLARQINLHLTENELDAGIPNNEYTQELKDFMNSDEAVNLKATLKKVEKEYKSESSTTKRPRIYLVAAVLTVLIISTLGIMFLGQDSSQKLYATYYSSEDVPSVITRDTDITSLQKGATAFEENNFSEALKNLEVYFMEEDSINPSVYIYTGMANAELGNYKNAISELDKLINSDALDSSKGLWFKALVYLKLDDKSRAKITLEELSKDSSNFNYGKAISLLEDL